jgi:hypothetical protein
MKTLTMEEKILEIIDNHTDEVDGHVYDYEVVAKEITTHVFEFIEWIGESAERMNHLWYVYQLAVEEKDACLTTEELYQYWLKEIKK